ncbi:MAG: metallophosphoesterase family protein [Bacteroidota bacterium]
MKYLSKPIDGRRFAIGDIHGCLASFQAMLRKLHLQPEDQLILLGDYVNRGPDSLGVLDQIIQLQTDGYKVHALRGNHEEMFLSARKGLLDPRQEQWLFDLPIGLETTDYYFTHAGLNFAVEDPLSDPQAMVWRPSFPQEPDEDFLGKRKLIQGHEIYSLSTIFDCIYDDGPVIFLDNGCYKGVGETEEEGIGNLCALNLDTRELIVQENVDERKEGGWEMW